MHASSTLGRLAIVVSFLVLAACSAPPPDEGLVGQATIAVAQTPADVSCIQITIAGGQTVQRSFDVTPGQPALLTLNGLPTGNDTFSALAFATPCSSVTSTSFPTWLSDPVQAVVTSSPGLQIALVMRPAGQVIVTIDFDGGFAGAVDSGSGSQDSGSTSQDSGSGSQDSGSGSQDSGAIDAKVDAIASDARADSIDARAADAGSDSTPNDATQVDAAPDAIACNPGFADCNAMVAGCETNIAGDLANCGGCNLVCAMPANANPACMAGICSFACTASFGNCDANAANGCETNISTSVANCGMCGRPCPSAANSIPVCMAAVCGVVCNVGFGNCDNNPGNGCEVNTNTNVTSCGMCGRACPSAPNSIASCSNGTCGLVCNVNFANCDNNPTNGCEVNLTTNAANCGTCGHLCPTMTTCVAGVCQ